MNIKGKVKIGIVVLFSLVGVYLLAGTAVKYKNEESALSQKQEQQLRDAEEAKKRKEEEAKKQQEEQKKLQEQKQAIDDKCNEAEKLFNKGSYKDAIAAAENILKEDGQNVRALTIKGISLCYTRKTSGQDDINKALTIKPDYGYALYNMALAYDIFWKYDEARVFYEKALQAESEVEIKALSNYYIAVIDARKGDINSAAKYLKAAVTIDGNLSARADGDPLLSKIKLNQ